MDALESIEFRSLLLAFERVEYHVQDVLKKQKEAIEDHNRNQQLPEWLTLEKAVVLKGGGAFNTYKTNQRLQPLCGMREKTLCGRKVWHRDTVLEWLSITDEQLDEYQKKCFGARHKKI